MKKINVNFTFRETKNEYKPVEECQTEEDFQVICKG